MIYIYLTGLLVVALASTIEFKSFKIWKWRNK